MSSKITQILFILLLIFSFEASADKKNSKLVTSSEILSLVNQDSKGTNIELIDLRTPREINKTGVIPGAEVNNYYSSSFEDSLKKLDRTKEYIVYCKSGGRSARAAAKMTKLGLKVRNYSEGIDGWLSKKNKTLSVSK